MMQRTVVKCSHTEKKQTFVSLSILLRARVNARAVIRANERKREREGEREGKGEKEKENFVSGLRAFQLNRGTARARSPWSLGLSAKVIVTN